MTRVAATAPHRARDEATATTVTVEPTTLMSVPMHMESMNCARNTMELTMATSVPSPRSCVHATAAPLASTSNCRQQVRCDQPLCFDRT